jgi:uncharacterized protein
MSDAVDKSLEQTLLEHLRAHPDFFVRHPQALLNLTLSDAKGSKKTTSLIERQLELTKKRLADTEKKLNTLLDNGRLNDTLAQHVQRLAISLLKATELNEVLTQSEQRLKRDFQSEQILWLMATPLAERLQPMHSLRVLNEGDALYEALELIIKAVKPRVGRLRGRLRDQIQKEFNPPVESVAWIPITVSGRISVLVIGSENPDHFDPTHSTDILERIAQLIGTALSRLAQE